MTPHPSLLKTDAKSLRLVVLAAGRSRRFGKADKLLADYGGRPVLAESLRRFAGFAFQRRVLVVGPRADAAAVIGRRFGFDIAVNPAPDAGLGRSIATGVGAAAPGDADGVMIALGDMPRIARTTVAALAHAFAHRADGAIVAPVHDGRRGHPVIFPSRFTPALLALDGDAGARGLLSGDAAAIAQIPVDDPGVVQDIDAPGDLDALARLG